MLLNNNLSDKAPESKKDLEKAVTIDELMGVALGCIHLSLDDFLRLTLDEFNAVYKAYTEDREATYRNAWEQMRLLATISISSHVKRAPTPQKLIPFPWDKTKHRLKTDAPQISKTDALARFKRRAGK